MPLQGFNNSPRWLAWFVVFVSSVVIAAGAVAAQTAKSEALAKELVSAMQGAKIDSIAAADPANPGVYIGAMNIPGVQLMVVGAKYSAPAALDAKIETKAYRDVYLDLSAAGLEQRVYIEDAAGDGLRVRRRTEKDSLDRAELTGKSVVFDYDFKRQKMSLDDYLKMYESAESRYTAMLQTLLAQVKKG